METIEEEKYIKAENRKEWTNEKERKDEWTLIWKQETRFSGTRSARWTITNGKENWNLAKQYQQVDFGPVSANDWSAEKSSSS